MTSAVESARTAMAAGDFDGALAVAERAVNEHPGVTALRDLMQGVAAAKAEHHRKAAPVWQMNYETGRLEARP